MTDAIRRFAVLRHRGSPMAMGIGTSLFLIALGAILKFAVNASVSGLESATIGVILMVVGIVGLIISLLFLLQRDREVAGGAVVRDRVVDRRVDPY